MVWTDRNVNPINRALVIALTCATLVKLYLALASQGSLDTAGFLDHLHKIRALGVGAYRIRGAFDNPFNSPPPMIHIIRFWAWLAESSGIPFRFWLRLPSVLADVGTFLLVARWLTKLWPDKNHFRVLMCLSLCPTAILISGYHGNTDSVMIFLLLLSIYLVEIGNQCAGFIFGLALCIKVVPLVFTPAIFLFLQGWRKRLRFFGLAALTFIICSLPYLVQDPRAIWSAVFGYSSIYGDWGWTLLASLYEPPKYLYGRFEPGDFHATLALILKCITAGLIFAASLWMNWKRKKPSLFIQLGLIIAILLFFAPGFGIQYLIWLVPFVVARGLRLTLLYYVTSGLFLIRAYACSWFPFCESPQVAMFINLGCWLSVVPIILVYRRVLQRYLSTYEPDKR